tara:strand:+ start:879 stop:1994 length:1116 start_codon:yes stop_codon:yes gene_type:complete
MEELEQAWDNYCGGDYKDFELSNEALDVPTPKCSELYISTKTKISYLNKKIDLNDVFWKIPVISYHIPEEGVIKKQMKFNSLSQDDLNIVTKQIDREKLTTNNHIDEYIIHQNKTTTNRNDFKDVRKISIGLSKKDITSYKCKKKSAFYNCFVVILRIKHENIFKEHSVKVFNTGKLQIPGIQTDDTLNKILDLLVEILSPFCCNTEPLIYLKDKHQTVLINSNFNCGYFIDREKLYNILKYSYNINSAYDPCSYPGIQCEFYYLMNSDVSQTGKQPTIMNEDVMKISFMIFRTGSVLIVGKCSEDIIKEIYIFIKNLLETEFVKIYSNIRRTNNNDTNISKNNKRKIRKKTIIIDKKNLKLHHRPITLAN